jgi:tRNA(His) 5'-end guanylyltransferase
MTLGERMKEYEMQSRTRLLRRTPVIIRLDGKAFHTWTRGLDRPFDKELMQIMKNTMLTLCNKIQGCVLGYTQSDEITLVLVDYQRIESMAWYDNQVQKICSVAASIATSAFEENLEDQIEALNVLAQWFNENNMSKDEKECLDKAELLTSKRFKANFDARAFNIPIHEVINNLIWRQQDATRNSINMVAQSLYPHKELQGIGTKELQNKMLTEKNVNWNDYKTDEKRGIAAIKDNEGKWFIDELTPIFTEDRDYINRLVYPESDD